MNKLMVMLANLQSDMIICAGEMRLVYGDNFEHSKELMGASDMVQDWIDNIKKDLLHKTIS